MARGCSGLPTSIASLGRESGRDRAGMGAAVRWELPAAKPVAGSEQRGRASGSELPATCAAAPLRLLEKGPHRSSFWRNSELETTYSRQL